MTGSESKKGPGIWPKLLLWSFVIVAGFLYLSSINDKKMREERPGEEMAKTADDASAKGETSAEPAAAPEASAQPQPIAAQEEQPAPVSERSAIVQSGIPVLADTQPAAAAVGQPSLQAAPSVPAAETHPVTQPATPQEKAWEPPAVPPVVSPTPAGTSPAPASPHAQAPSAPFPGLSHPSAVTPSIPGTTPVGGESAPVAAAPMSTLETTPAPIAPPAPTAMPSGDRGEVSTSVPAGHQAQPLLEAVASKGSRETQTQIPALLAAPAEPAQSSVGSMSVDPTARQPGATITPDPAMARMDDRRARIMAEYRARQRMRQEQMRRYWESMRRSQIPAIGPYETYPGYYAPDYYRPW